MELKLITDDLPKCRHRGSPFPENGLFPCSSPKLKVPREGVSSGLCQKCPFPDQGEPVGLLGVTPGVTAGVTPGVPQKPAKDCNKQKSKASSRTTHCVYLGDVLKDKDGRAVTKNSLD